MIGETIFSRIVISSKGETFTTILLTPSYHFLMSFWINYCWVFKFGLEPSSKMPRIAEETTGMDQPSIVSAILPPRDSQSCTHSTRVPAFAALHRHGRKLNDRASFQ